MKFAPLKSKKFSFFEKMQQPPGPPPGQGGSTLYGKINFKIFFFLIHLKSFEKKKKKKLEQLVQMVNKN